MAICKYVTEEEYMNHISQFTSIRKVGSIHRDDTDFKTYTEIDGQQKLIGWADYYRGYWYIYL